MRAHSRRPASLFARRPFLARGGFTLLEMLIVIAIVALLLFFVLRCQGSGSGTSGGMAGSASISAARETLKTAAKNLTIASAPVFDCKQAAALSADVTAAQTKINDAAKDYPADYAASKSAIQLDIDNVNQQITLFNHDCNSTIPLLTLP